MTALVIISSVILLIILLLNFPVTAYLKFYDKRLTIAVKYLGIPLLPKREKAPRKKKRRRKKPSLDPPSKSLPQDEGEEIFEDIADIGLSGTETETGGDVPREYVPPSDVREILQAAKDEPSSQPGETNEQPEKPNKKNLRKRRKSKKEKPPGKAEKKPLSDILESLESKKDAAALLWELCGGRVTRLIGKVRITGLVIDFAAAHEDAAKAAVSYGALCAAFYDMLGTLMSITPIGISSIRIDCLYNTPSEKSRYDCEAKIKLRPSSVLNALAGIAAAYIAGGQKYKPALEEFTKK